jgi:hypothetical protein
MRTALRADGGERTGSYDAPGVQEANPDSLIIHRPSRSVGKEQKALATRMLQYPVVFAVRQRKGVNRLTWKKTTSPSARTSDRSNGPLFTKSSLPRRPRHDERNNVRPRVTSSGCVTSR